MAYRETAAILKSVEIILELAPGKEEALQYIKEIRRELKEKSDDKPDQE